MPLTDEQAKTIKEQLLGQIENLPEDKKEYAKKFIGGMNNEQLEEFIVKNNLLKQNQPQPSEQGPESNNGDEQKVKRTDCIYCLLSNHQIESLPIYEDGDYLGVLEIKPFSEGHVILVPKAHLKTAKSLKSKAFKLANQIGKHLVKQLKAENFHISSSDEMQHAIINIIPIHKGEKLSFERKQIEPKKLQELAVKIGGLPAKQKKEKAKKKASEEETAPEIKEEKAKEALIRLPRRIP